MRLDEAERIYGQLAGRIGRIIGGDPETIVFRRQADTRFAGQAHELTVPFTDGALDRAAVTELCARFEAAHLSRYGHAFSGEFPVEVVNLRLIGTRVPERQGEPSFRPKADGGAEGRRKAHFGPAFGAVAASVVSRARLTATPRRGPMIIEEYDSTTVVPPDCSARLDPMGNVIIDVEKSA
jgi:N-methylhydantoinase A